MALVRKARGGGGALIPGTNEPVSTLNIFVHSAVCLRVLKLLFYSVGPLWKCRFAFPWCYHICPVAFYFSSLCEEISGAGRRGQAFRGIPNLGIPLITGC